MFLDERKLKEFVASRPTHKQCLKEVLQMEVNDKKKYWSIRKEEKMNTNVNIYNRSSFYPQDFKITCDD